MEYPTDKEIDDAAATIKRARDKYDGAFNAGYRQALRDLHHYLANQMQLKASEMLPPQPQTTQQEEQTESLFDRRVRAAYCDKFGAEEWRRLALAYANTQTPKHRHFAWLYDEAVERLSAEGIAVERSQGDLDPPSTALDSEPRIGHEHVPPQVAIGNGCRRCGASPRDMHECERPDCG